MNKTFFKELLIAIAILFVGSIILILSNADLRLQSLFFNADKGWFLGNDFPWKFLYLHGNIPAIFILFASVIFLIAGFWSIQFLKFRKIALFFILVLVIGPGLFVNMVFKDHWGRPRPRDIDQFGGSMQYCELWQIGVPGKGKSFPCGHASVGFFLMIPYFLLRNRHPKWAVAVFAGGLSYGLLMGIGRMIQGAHFATDVLWSGGMVYLTGLGLFYLLGLDKGLFYELKDKGDKGSKIIVTAIVIVTASLIFLGLILATPNHSNGEYALPASNKIHYKFKKADVQFVEGTSLLWNTHGFGYPKSRMLAKAEENKFTFKTKGFFTELNHNVSIGISGTLTNVLEIDEGDIHVEMSHLKPKSCLVINLIKGDVTVNEGKGPFRILTDNEVSYRADPVKLKKNETGYNKGNGEGAILKIHIKTGKLTVK